MDADPRIDIAARDLALAEHGDRQRIVERLASELGVSKATAHRRISSAAPRQPRKRRSDAGQSDLCADEAEKIWSLIVETTRLTGTGALPMLDAVQILRANGEIVAGRVDTATGEFLPLSESAIRRAMRAAGYSIDQMGQDSPATRLSSPHPNWCWQIDASLSRQFYLADDGTRVMPKGEFYRGKPQNFTRISDRRIWRYVVTDHCSGCIEVFYVQGAESAANVVATLIHTMTNRPNGTMHGVPRYLMSDPGSGMIAAPVKNMLSALGVNLIINKVHNARAKGQVENANHLVEIHFEGMLKLQAPVTSIAQINEQAQEWARTYNMTRVHSRTGMTRRDGWLRITPDQLVLAPAIDVLKRLPNSAAKACTVRDCLIRFRGKVYDVRDLPGGTVNGQKIMVRSNALDEGCVRVMLSGEDGIEQHYLAPLLRQDDWGFL